MEQNTPYSPLMRGPLKMRGVFGLSWQLYKRGFWPMFWFTLLLVGVIMLLFMLAAGNVLSQAGAFEAIEKDITPGTDDSAPLNDTAVAAVQKFKNDVSLGSLIYAFLIIPAYTGTIFMEMDQRMEGRCGTLDQLLRYALPTGLKRYYTTFLSLLVVQIIAGIVMSIVRSIFTPILISAASIMLCSFLLSIVNTVFICLIYPVAAHEGKRAFAAVSRALKLSLKRFGRLLGAIMLGTLIVVVLLVVLLLPFVLLSYNFIDVFIGLCAGLLLWTMLIGSYAPALCTALYVDAAARVLDVPPEAPAQPQAS